MTERNSPAATITVFGSSRPHPGEPAYRQAYELGRALAAAGFRVCNGGYGGTMEAAARGAKENGGRTLGVTCELFTRGPNHWIDEEVKTPRLEERLIRLAETGDGFVILPGGTGTLLELAYVLELVNKRFAAERPIVLLGSFWQPVLEPLKEEMQQEGLGELARFLSIAATPDAAVEQLRRLSR